jgi:hypothetical protein
MTPKQRLKHGNEFPFDATDSWWEGDGNNPLPPRDRWHAAARGVIAELQDRRGIKQGFDDLDEDVRADIVNTLAKIIREAMK